MIVLSRTTRFDSSAVSAVRLTESGELDLVHMARAATPLPRAGLSFAEFVNDPIQPRVYALRDGKLTIALWSEKELLFLRLGRNGELDRASAPTAESSAR